MIPLACLQREKSTVLLFLLLFSENSFEVAVSMVENFSSEEVKAISMTVKFCTQFSLVNPPIHKSYLPVLAV